MPGLDVGLRVHSNHSPVEPELNDSGRILHMRQIIISCVLLLVLLVAIVGCLAIFGVLSVDAALSTALEFGAAIVFLGGCAALAVLIFGKK